MENKISFHPEPLINPYIGSPRILVIGGGVTGLVTSWALLDRGYHVTVLAKEWASYGEGPRLTSQIAGALWEYPPAVCGQHTDIISLHHSRRWCMTAYRIWDAIAADPELVAVSGVRMKKSAFFFPYAIPDDQVQFQKMLDIEKSGVRGFLHSASLIQHYGINPSHVVVDAYELLAPIIDTDQAMTWLMDLVESKGATFVTETIHGDIFDHELELRQRFHADVIINATGLAGYETAGDASCYPIRGGLVRVINDGVGFPRVDAALSISADAGYGANEIVFIVPRSDRVLLLGGISEPHQWDLDHRLDTPIIQRMRERCEDFLPVLKNAQLDPDYPLAQGLRPFRGSNVRVERELRRHGDASTPLGAAVSRIVHNYGHGGAGWSLSFGCAEDVLHLVEEALNDLPPRPMTLDGQNYKSIPDRKDMARL